MTQVNEKKLEAVARFIKNGDIGEECVCGFFLQSLSEEMRDEINAPCHASGYADKWCFDCPFFTREGTIEWLKE